MPPALIFLLSLLIEGALAGAIYALIALAFVLVYKSSRMVNFALGEWIILAATLTAVGQSAIGMGLAAAIVFAAAGMALFGIAFDAIVVRRLVSRPAISRIIVTIGLGARMRGGATLIFAGIPGGLRLPVLVEPLIIHGVPIPPEKLIASVTAAVIIAVVTWFYQCSRTGV